MGVSQMIMEFIRKLLGLFIKPKSKEKKPVIMLENSEWTEVNPSDAEESKKINTEVHTDKTNVEAGVNTENNKVNDRMDALIKEMNEIKQRLNEKGPEAASIKKEEPSSDHNKVADSSEKEKNSVDSVYEKIAKMQAETATVVQNAIMELPTVDTVTLSDKPRVIKAKDAYSTLTNEQKKHISLDTVNKLNEVVLKVEKLQADAEAAKAAEMLIQSLPSLNTISLMNKPQVEKASVTFESLSNDQKSVVNKESLKKLEQLSSKIKEMQADKDSAIVVEKEIEALKQPNQIKHTDFSIVFEVKDSFEKLTTAQKSYIDKKNTTKLDAAFNTAKKLKADLNMADSVTELIDTIKDFHDVSRIDKNAVKKILASFNELNDMQKSLIPEEKVSFLTDISKKIDKLESGIQAAQKVAKNLEDLKIAPELTLNDKSKVFEVKAAFDMLSTEQKDLVAAELVKKLETSINKIMQLQVDGEVVTTVEKTIESLPTPSELTLGHKAKLSDAKIEYDTLTVSQKSMLAADKVLKLNALVSRIKKIETDMEAVQEIISEIDRLTGPNQYGAIDRSAVEKAKAAFGALTSDQKELVEKNKINKLDEIIRKLDAEKAQVERVINESTLTASMVASTRISESVKVTETENIIQQPRTPGQKLNVLIVDDAAFMRTILRKIIEELGEYVIVGEATNGHEALVEVQKSMPDIITMDITMPDMDGITAVKKALEIHPRAKIVMCTAVNQKTMIVQAIKNGAKDFITKPFDKGQVAEALKSVASL